MGVSRFEDLIAWQKARVLTRTINEVSRRPIMSRDFGFTNQIQRAAVSSMSNIAEGFEDGGAREFKRYLTTSKGSAAEVRSLLYLASDIGYVQNDEFAALMSQASEVSRLVGGLRASAAKQAAIDDSRKRTRPPK